LTHDSRLTHGWAASAVYLAWSRSYGASDPQLPSERELWGKARPARCGGYH